MRWFKNRESCKRTLISTGIAYAISLIFWIIFLPITFKDDNPSQQLFGVILAIIYYSYLPLVLYAVYKGSVFFKRSKFESAVKMQLLPLILVVCLVFSILIGRVIRFIYG